jgi:hypothetical protein
MLVLNKKSGLVRLSDAVKTGLGTCSDTSAEVLQCFSKDESLYRAAEKIFDEALGGRVDLKEAHSKIRSTLRPIGDPGHLAYLQTKLHNQALPTVLTCCFILESYINTLASSSLPERALEAFNRISRTLDKWSAFAKVNHGVGFDRSQSPFQDFKILFRFRDDCVHDKLIELSNDRQRDRYNGRLPDPVTGHLDLNHVIWAADVYWRMVQELHRITATPTSTFHRHYNLAPWFNDDRKRALLRQAAEYRKRLEGRLWSASFISTVDQVEFTK